MATDVTRERVMHAVLERQAAKYGDRAFMYFEERVYSYQGLNQQANHVASGLQKLGIVKGDKVAIVMDNCPEFIFTIYGLSKLGAVQVSINTAHKGDILNYLLDLSESRIVIAHTHYMDRIQPVLARLPKVHTVVLLDKALGPSAEGHSAVSSELEKLGKRVMDWSELVDNDANYEPADVIFSDPYSIMFTSGTTGPSKGALTSHNLVYSVTERLCNASGLNEQDFFYNFFPLFHNSGQITSTALAVTCGAQMFLIERFSPSRFWDDVKRFNCTQFCYTGSVLPMLFKPESRPDDADNSLRIGLGGGAPKNIFSEFEKRFGLTLLEFYGTSECGIPLVSDLKNRKPGSCGIVHPDYNVKVVDDNGLEVGPNTPGEVLTRPVRPYVTMQEFYRMPEKTVEFFRDLWLHTGDYLYYDNDGFFYFFDRKKDYLRRRGENISSFEVEKAISSHPAVLECAVVATKSELGEDEVLACLQLKPEQRLEALDLIKYCEDKIAYFMVPRYVRILEAMPKTATMRVEKYRLREEGITPDTWDREKAGYKLKR